MSVTKEQMGELTSLVNKSQGIPDPDPAKQQAGTPNPDPDPQAGSPDPDAGDTFVNEDNEPVNKDGERINAEGQLIDDDNNVINADPNADPDAAPDAGDDSTYTPKALADAIGWETEDLYNSVMIPMDDGQPSVSLGDLKNTHQNLVRDHQALQTKMTEQSGALQQAQTGFAQGQQMSAEMMEAQSYLMQVNRMEQETDWKELEADDAAQAVLKRQQIQQARSDIGEQINKINYQQQQAQQVYMQQAGVKMVELIPTWSDDKVRQADQDLIRTGIMHKAGFSDAEIDSIVDPRTMMLLKELQELRGLQASAKKAVKKVRKAPRVLAGNRGVRRAKAGEQTKSLVKQAHKTGSKGDQLNAVKSILGAKPK